MDLRAAVRAARARDWLTFSKGLKAGFAAAPPGAIERSFLLRLLGIAHFVNGHAGDGHDCFVKAADLEQRAGHDLGRNHTSHELALLTSSQGDMSKIQSYYKETLQNLKGMKNLEGMALCMRSLGELALVGGFFDQGVACFETSRRFFGKTRPAEAAGVRAFLRLLRGDQAPSTDTSSK